MRLYMAPELDQLLGPPDWQSFSTATLHAAEETLQAVSASTTCLQATT